VLTLKVIQAYYGDCMIVGFGKKASPKYLLIDGGSPNTYANHLKKELKNINAANNQLELIVLTHIDNDHISGIVELLNELRDLKAQHKKPIIRIAAIWHNAFEKTVEMLGDVSKRLATFSSTTSPSFSNSEGNPFRGMAEGEKTLRLVQSLEIPLNQGFTKDIILCEDSPNPFILDDLKLWIVGPNEKNLEKLKKEWLDWIKSHDKALRSARKSVSIDTSTPNLSSIVMLVESGDKKILLTGDATYKDILEGLRKVGQLDETGKLHVDILKLPHHGSARNVSEKFFEMVTADQYIVSADGTNGNPDFQTLKWLILSAANQKRSIQIFATNETKSIREVTDAYDQKNYGYSITCLRAGENSMVL
jgi:beta-lactamase superfamily II metal-dependent hydrolase